MLKLKEITQETLEWYYEKIRGHLDFGNLSKKSKDFLEDETVKALLIEKPMILLDIHTCAPCELKNKSIVEKVFDYHNLISNSKATSYEISKKIGINTCTYCNRNYTLTIIEKDKKTGNENDTTRISRPQFDHFFSQNDYPLLSLSIYNLIPSCSICNSTIKGSKPLELKKHLHPYIHEDNKSEEQFKFSYGFNELLSKLSVRLSFEKEANKIKNTLEFFKINEVYNAHSDFELQDLYNLRYKYSNNYLDILCTKTFEGLNLSQEEAYRAIFGIEIKEEDFHKRPFSKFKKDIIDELLRIK